MDIYIIDFECCLETLSMKFKSFTRENEATLACLSRFYNKITQQITVKAVYKSDVNFLAEAQRLNSPISFTDCKLFFIVQSRMRKCLWHYHLSFQRMYYIEWKPGKELILIIQRMSDSNTQANVKVIDK